MQNAYLGRGIAMRSIRSPRLESSKKSHHGCHTGRLDMDDFMHACKKPSKSSSRGEGPSNLKGKGPDPRNWGALSACEDKLDLEAQREALASLAQEPDAKAQRAAIASWNKVHELTKQEPRSRDGSHWAPSSREGSLMAPEGSNRPVKVLSPEFKKAAKKAPDPVRAIVDKAIAQDKSRHKRHKTPGQWNQLNRSITRAILA